MHEGVYVYGCTCIYVYMNISMCGGVGVCVGVNCVVRCVCRCVSAYFCLHVFVGVSVGMFFSVFVCVSVHVYVCRSRCECVFCGCMRLVMCLWEYPCTYLLVYGCTNILIVLCV